MTRRLDMSFWSAVSVGLCIAACSAGNPSPSKGGTAGDSAGGDAGTAGTSSGAAAGVSGVGASAGSAGVGTAGSATAGSGAGGSAGVGTAGSGNAGAGTAGSGTAGTGTAGSGAAGASGSGAAGASGSGAGGSAGGPNGACPTGAIFCADFESGSIPTQAVYFPDYQRTMQSMYAAVDTTLAHGGTHSLKITPGGNFSSMFGVTTGVSTFWTRVYLRTDVDTNTVMGHDSFVLATDGNGDPNAGEHIRIGEHSCQLEINRKSDDKEILSDAVNGQSNYQCAGGIAFAKNTWYCLEVYYNGPGKEVRVFVDNVESTALHVTDWGPYTYDMFKFGFENYGGSTRNLWYDDVAIAATRIGCN